MNLKMKFIGNLIKDVVSTTLLCGFGLAAFEGWSQTSTVDFTNQSPTAMVDIKAQFAANEAAAKDGDAKILFELARAYDHGLGVTRDPAKAAEYAKQAAEKDYPPAETLLGSYYGRGFGVPKNPGQALQWYRKAADQGYALAQLALGGFYQSGTGVPRDWEQAIAWLTKAADQDNAAAQCQLGLIYFNGGLSGDTNHVNYPEAVKWLKKSADHGYIGAMNNLGLAYIYGLGGLKVDPVTAEKWLRQAAEKGSANAQASLGLLYADGAQGVPANPVEAYVWLSLSARGGNVEGKHTAKEIAANLSPAEQERANEMIKYYDEHHNAPVQTRGEQ